MAYAIVVYLAWPCRAEEMKKLERETVGSGNGGKADETRTPAPPTSRPS